MNGAGSAFRAFSPSLENAHLQTLLARNSKTKHKTKQNTTFWLLYQERKYPLCLGCEGCSSSSSRENGNLCAVEPKYREMSSLLLPLLIFKCCSSSLARWLWPPHCGSAATQLLQMHFTSQVGPARSWLQMRSKALLNEASPTSGGS